MTSSLRSRFLTGFFISTSFLLAIFSFMIFTISKHTLISEFDKSLMNSGSLLSAAVEYDNIEDKDYTPKEYSKNSEPVLEFEINVQMTPAFNKINGGAYYQIENTERTIMFKSPSLGNNRIDFFTQFTTTPQTRACILPNGKPGRALGYLFQPKGSRAEILIFTMAQDCSNIVQSLHFLSTILATSSISIILLSVAISWLITKNALKPIHSLGNQISAVNPDDLDETEISANVPTELLPITEKLNDLITRLKSAFARQRQYNADVAHELRTPLAGLQTTIEVCLLRERESHDYKETLNECLYITKNMKQMTENLLTLTKLQFNQITPDYQHVRLDSWLNDIIKPFIIGAKEKDLTIVNEIPDNLFVKMDISYTSIILTNLLNNAIEYTPASGTINIHTAQQSNTTELFISNSGCTLTNEDIEHLFDPFWRADNSRQSNSNHYGIGLSIAHRIATTLELNLTARITPPDTFTASLLLPNQ